MWQRCNSSALWARGLAYFLLKKTLANSLGISLVHPTHLLFEIMVEARERGVEGCEGGVWCEGGATCEGGMVELCWRRYVKLSC